MLKSNVTLQLELEEKDLIIYVGEESLVMKLTEVSSLYHSLGQIKTILQKEGLWTDEKGIELL